MHLICFHERCVGNGRSKVGEAVDNFKLVVLNNFKNYNKAYNNHSTITEHTATFIAFLSCKLYVICFMCIA